MKEFDRSLAVVIGINDYQNGIDTLQSAVPDAVAIAEILQNTYNYQLIHPDLDARAEILQNTYNYQLIDPDLDSRVVVDQYATKENLETLLTEILPNKIKPTKSDRLIFYFAGHGIARNSDDEPQGFLVPQDADMKQQDSLLRMRDVHDWLAKLECKHLLVILDCCFAGAFRWASYRKLIPITEEITKAHYDRFIRFPAWQVLTSASHNQEALEFLNNRDIKSDKKHSPFAEGLIEALQQSKGDLNKDGVIIATELYQYLRDYVEVNSEERQTPGFFPLKKHDRGEYLFKLPNTPLNLKETPELNKENNPYRGLEPFEARHAKLFFGRDEVVEKLSRKVAEPSRQLTVVTGISGSGKSSLVKAGLIHNLRPFEKRSIYKLSLIYSCILTLTIIENFPCFPIKFLPINYIYRWHVLKPIRPGKNPFNNLLRALFPLDDESKNCQDPIKLIQKWSQKKPDFRILLVIDQFEEIITFADKSKGKTIDREKSWLKKLRDNFKSSKAKSEQNNLENESEEWQKFIELLTTILQKCPQLSLVVTLRSDFEPRFQDSAFSSDWANARFVVRPMRSDELREAVEKPAAEKALYFEPPDLVDRLVDEVSQMPGALPLLSFTLSEMYIKLYEAWSKEGKEDRALTVTEEFEQKGGVAGALTRRANEIYHNLPNNAYKLMMQRVMLRMVEFSGGEAVRSRVLASELIYLSEEENQRKDEILNDLLKARLIVTGTDIEANEQYYEPAHDYLIRGWGNLQDWIRESGDDLTLQKRLAVSASDWSKGKGGLWTREIDRLTRLEKILESQDNNWLNQKETEFVTKSKKQRLDELKEAENQRDKAVEGQIDALNSLSEASFLGNNQLEALTASLKAGKRLLQASPIVQNKVRKTTENVLRQTIYGIQEKNRIQGHSGMVWDVSFSQDGKMLASASYDKTIKIWRIDGTLLQTFEGHTSDVSSVCFCPNDKIIASGSYDNTIKIWKIDGTLLQTIEGHTNHVTCVSFSSNGKMLASASHDNTIKIWNLNGDLIHTLKGHSLGIWRVNWSPDGKLLASASADKTIKLWNLNGRNTNTLRGHSEAVTDISFSPDGKLLASASDDKTIKLWNLNGKNLNTLQGHNNRVWSVCFSPDSQLLVSSSWDNTIKLWERDGALLQTIEGHSNRVWRAKFSPLNQIIASASADSTIRFWLVNRTLSKTIGKHDDWVWSSAFSNNNHLIASGSSDKTVKLWKTDGTWLRTLDRHNGIVNSVSLSSKAEIIASASADQTIRLWDFNGKQLEILKGHTDRVRNVVFSPDGQILASTSHDGTIKLWNLQGELLETLEGHSAEVVGISFSPDGQILASTSYDRTIKLWNLQGKLLKTLEGHSAGVIDVSFSPDGSLIASVSDDRTIKIWQNDGTLQKTLQGHSDWVFSVSFSWDSQIIASGSADKTIKLWNRQGDLLTTLKGHNDWVLDVCFSPDKRLLVSASSDKTVKLWNIEGIDYNLSLEELLKCASQWLHDYLKSNKNISLEDLTLI